MRNNINFTERNAERKIREHFRALLADLSAEERETVFDRIGAEAAEQWRNIAAEESAAQQCNAT